MDIKLQYSVLELTVCGSEIVLRSTQNRVNFELVRNGTNLANIVVRDIVVRDNASPLCFVHFKQRGAYRMQDMLMVGSDGYVYELEYDGGCDRPFHSHNPLRVPKSLWRSDYLYKTVGAYPHSEGGFVFVVPKTIIATDSVAFDSVTNNQMTGRTVTGVTGSDSVTGSESIHRDWLDSPFRFDMNDFNSVDDVKAYMSDSKNVNMCICLSQDGCRIKTVSRYRAEHWAEHRAKHRDEHRDEHRAEHRRLLTYKPFPVYFDFPESVNAVVVDYPELEL